MIRWKIQKSYVDYFRNDENICNFDEITFSPVFFLSLALKYTYYYWENQLSNILNGQNLLLLYFFFYQAIIFTPANNQNGIRRRNKKYTQNHQLSRSVQNLKFTIIVCRLLGSNTKNYNLEKNIQMIQQTKRKCLYNIRALYEHGKTYEKF